MCMVSKTNPRAFEFDDVYNPSEDTHDDPARARFELIRAKHIRPDSFKPLLD